MVECLLFTMAKTIKRNFVYNLLLQISAVLFPIITAPYIARVLDPDGVGIVNFVNTYASYFALFAVLGIPTYGIRVVDRSIERECAIVSVGGNISLYDAF